MTKTTSSIKCSAEKYWLTFFPFDFDYFRQKFKIPVTELKGFNGVPEHLSDPVK